jgi:hypothetical protein
MSTFVLTIRTFGDVSIVIRGFLPDESNFRSRLDRRSRVAGRRSPVNRENHRPLVIA